MRIGYQSLDNGRIVKLERQWTQRFEDKICGISLCHLIRPTYRRYDVITSFIYRGKCMSVCMHVRETRQLDLYIYFIFLAFSYCFYIYVIETHELDLYIFFQI